MQRAFVAFWLILIVAVALTAAPAQAVGPPLSAYVVYGENGVIIGIGSTVAGLVGARHNNSVFNKAIKVTGQAVIDGDARSGDDVALLNNATITGTLRRAVGTTLTMAASASVGTDLVVDPELPLFPPPTGITCPTGGVSHSGGNGQSLALGPGSYGALSFGGQFELTLTGAGNYFFDSISTGHGATINIAAPGVHVFVCGAATFGSVEVLPTSLGVGDVTVEVQSNDIENAFRAGGGSAWIGDVFAPNGGIHIGSGGAVSSFVGSLHALTVVDIEHGVDGHNGGGDHHLPPPGKDATLLHANKNTNNGANLSLRVKYQVSTLVGFDVHTVNFASVQSAILRLTICYTPFVPDFCPDPSSSWPAAGGDIFAFRLDEGYEDWEEGNGNNFPINNNPHGTGLGVTWNCKTDTNIANVNRDCTGADFWATGGLNVQGAPVGPVVITNNMPNGTTVDFDVTADVQAGLGTDSTFMSWFVRRLGGSGFVSFYSREGAAAAGNTAFAPQLIITP